MSGLSFQTAILNPIVEIHSLMPDSILFGSLLLYLLTQNFAFGVFAVFIFENVLCHRLISWFISQFNGPSDSGSSSKKNATLSDNLSCRMGFKTPSFSINRIFDHDAYPSYGIFSITAIATYLGLATSEFSNTMDQMGDSWTGRSTMAYVLIGIFLVAFIVGRMALQCNDILSEIIYAVVFAVMVGAIFFRVNKALFGVESMNFLGLPYVVSKDSTGSPIYVCSAMPNQ